MYSHVSIAEARDHLTGLVRDVERGKTVELTRRGKPVAVLISREEYERLRGKGPSLVEALRAWQGDCPSDFEGLTPQEVAALRDRSPGRDVSFP